MVIDHRVLCMVSCLWLASAPPSVSAADDAAQIEFFEKKIRPILVGSCYTCHSANTNSKGGLRVDDRNGLLTGGGRGPAIVPGKPEESLLIRAVRHTDDKLKMPPEKQLTEEEIGHLVQWIEQGAAWPPEAAWTPDDLGEEYERLRREHWAWQPLRESPVPTVTSALWPRDDIDAFLLARLEERGLRPVADADKPALIRRVTFDLTGLPPRPEDIAAFVNDSSPLALERVVDRLLESPAFGERWGRHWLDLARFGESTGSARNVPYPHAWRYRDYVICALNADKPYDQFLREQIAGDLLPAGSPEERDEHLIATGFLALGVKDVNQRFKVRFVMDNIDEQIDAVSRSVLALTASCARCHDHKFDPIPQVDYYALAGIFHSTDLCAGVRNKMGGGGLDYYDTAMLLPLGPPRSGTNPEIQSQLDQKQRELTEAQAELKEVQESLANKDQDRPADALKLTLPAEAAQKLLAKLRQTVNQRRNEIAALNDPALHGPIALGVRDAQVIGDTEIRIRGEAERLGPKVPRGFLSALNVPETAAVNQSQSGRLELARWLTSPQNPLTPRVMVNRIWKHLFGQGLVRSVDNFGVTGEKPSHPELLDHLAVRFVRHGWSMKSLVRSVVLSRAYQLSAETTPAHLASDPENRLLWRHSPRRLDAEEIRDAILFASGSLDAQPPAASAAKNLKVIELPNNGGEAKKILEEVAASTHRSVYLPLVRGITPTHLEVFDFADQGLVTGSRNATTVAPQALYLLNDPFVRRQSLTLAERLLTATNNNDADRIRLAYEFVLCRTPSTAEVERAISYLHDYATAADQSSPPTLAAGEQDRATGSPGASSVNDQGESEKSSTTSTRIPPPPALPEDRPQAAAPQNSSRQAAWISFCQALFGSAEFRYVK